MMLSPERTDRSMEDHVKAIAEYLGTNAGYPNTEEYHSNRGKYIIPAVTLNVNDPLRVYTIRTSSTVRSGYLVIPDTAKLDTTDGQHRLQAVIDAYVSMSERDQTVSGWTRSVHADL